MNGNKYTLFWKFLKEQKKYRKAWNESSISVVVKKKIENVIDDMEKFAQEENIELGIVMKVFLWEYFPVDSGHIPLVHCLNCWFEFRDKVLADGDSDLLDFSRKESSLVEELYSRWNKSINTDVWRRLFEKVGIVRRVIIKRAKKQRDFLRFLKLLRLLKKYSVSLEEWVIATVNGLPWQTDFSIGYFVTEGAEERYLSWKSRLNQMHPVSGIEGESKERLDKKLKEGIGRSEY